jgi:4-hydroxybenzoate polyprenyltransferase
MIRAWLELARISNLPTVWTNVTAGWLLAGGDLGNPLLLWMLAAGSLLYTGGMILNDAADVRFDREHRKERPIPSGRVSAAAAWSVGLGMLTFGWYLAVFFGTASWEITTALVGCILFYDFYHKPWAGAVWVMGMCRVLLFLMPSSAAILCATCKVPGWALALLPALALGAYIVGLTMVARLEAKGAASSRVHLWFSRFLLSCPGMLAGLMLFEAGRMKPVFILADFTPLIPLVIIGVFALWVLFAMRIMRQGGPSIGRAVGLLLAGIPIVDALAVSQVSLPLAFGFVALAPVLRIWQRWIAAT